MDHVCLAMPVVPGRSEDARRFMKQLDGARREEFDASERRVGISKELWYLAKLPSGDHLVGYIESTNFAHAFQSFVSSRDLFDLWFKDQFRNATGVDLNDPPPDLQMPELLSHYEGEAAG
jgi:hypothetical protein